MKIDPICNMVVIDEDITVIDDNGQKFYFCSEGCKNKFLVKVEEKNNDLNDVYDLVIIGGGPAGLTAGVYAALLRLKVLLISQDLGGQAIDSTKIKNYMGYDFITGPDLVNKFKEQLLHSNYIEHYIDEVDNFYKKDDLFIVKTKKNKKIFTKTIILASGMKRRKLGINGEEKFQRKGLFYGNIQDIAFLHKKNAVVIGGGNSAMQIVENLQSVADKIYLISDIPLTADDTIVEKIKNFTNVVIFEGYAVNNFIGEEQLLGVEIKKISKDIIQNLEVGGVFIAIGLQPNSAIAANNIKINHKGEIMIDPNCATSTPGIFAAGDVTDAFGKRIVIASGEGAKASLAVRQYLLDLKNKRR